MNEVPSEGRANRSARCTCIMNKNNNNNSRGEPYLRSKGNYFNDNDFLSPRIFHRELCMRRAQYSDCAFFDALHYIWHKCTKYMGNRHERVRLCVYMCENKKRTTSKRGARQFEVSPWSTCAQIVSHAAFGIWILPVFHCSFVFFSLYLSHSLGSSSCEERIYFYMLASLAILRFY